MEIPQIIKALRRNMVETGSLICVGCGREHNCSTHGCAIMREASDALEKMTRSATTENKALLQTIRDANELIRALIRKEEPNPCEWCTGKNCITCCLCTQNDDDECNFSLALDPAPVELLTLEQIRKMDGEPVWINYDCTNAGEWYCVNSKSGWLIGAHGKLQFCDIKFVGKAYARKPEGSQKP